MKRIYFTISLFVALCTIIACGSGENTTTSNTSDTKIQSVPVQQLNISILLDLSDRINPKKFPANPSHIERDIENIKTITEFFKSNMQALKAHNAKGKIRVFFSPIPKSSAINTIASELRIDCADMMNNQKREVYETISQKFTENLEKIYKQAINTKTWDGSDIWRFFKDDVKDFCIDQDSNYRNILIVFTDGYVYHKQSRYKRKNQFSYLLDWNLKPYRKSNWKKLIEQNRFGLMAERKDLEKLEVLILEVSAENPNNKIDEDIISHVLEQWLKKMKVSHCEVYPSNLPSNTKKRINDFLNKK
ncbi:MAG: hypothetical protein ACRC3G_00960 [Bacteroidales bacterium]